MLKSNVFAIGAMSGTSLDGLDLVFASFDSNDYQKFDIIHAVTIPYTDKWKNKLKKGITLNKKELAKLDLVFGNYLGREIQNFIDKKQIKQLNFIASHGHTIFHEPSKGVTLQIGSGKKIAEITNVTTVYDFRSQDVALGGQGAPLVPIGDKLLFSQYDCCLNLGGFSNISFDDVNKRIAYDVCPVNIVLNYYAAKLGLNYDDKGKIAKSGSLNVELLEALNQLEYYAQKPPKSLGLEWVKEHVFPLINRHEKDILTILHTFTVHAAYQIGKEIEKFATVLVTGGGAFNSFLMHSIQKVTKKPIKNVDNNLINYKEALVFAFLGLLKLKGENNCLRSVTGALKDHSSGVIIRR